MFKKLVVFICMISLTVLGLSYVDLVCAESYLTCSSTNCEASTSEDDYIDLDDVPVEEIIMYPGFNSPGLPYEIDPQDAIDLVYNNIETNFIPNFYEEPECIIGEVEYLTYTEEEFELLAHLIFAEAGSDWCSDKMQYYTGSVVLNRIASPLFPNNMHDVIYQHRVVNGKDIYQYSVVKSGAINKTPNERAYNAARFLLENGSVLPANVVFQSQHIQGDGIYEQVQNMYFCYKN